MTSPGLFRLAAIAIRRYSREPKTAGDFLPFTNRGTPVDQAAIDAVNQLIGRIAMRREMGPREIVSRCRSRYVTRARHEAFATMHDEMGWSKLAISRFFELDRRCVQRGIESHRRRG